MKKRLASRLHKKNNTGFVQSRTFLTPETSQQENEAIVKNLDILYRRIARIQHKRDAIFFNAVNDLLHPLNFPSEKFIEFCSKSYIKEALLAEIRPGQTLTQVILNPASNALAKTIRLTIYSLSQLAEHERDKILLQPASYTKTPSDDTPTLIDKLAENRISYTATPTESADVYIDCLQFLSPEEQVKHLTKNEMLNFSWLINEHPHHLVNILSALPAEQVKTCFTKSFNSNPRIIEELTHSELLPFWTSILSDKKLVNCVPPGSTASRIILHTLSDLKENLEEISDSNDYAYMTVQQIKAFGQQLTNSYGQTSRNKKRSDTLPQIIQRAIDLAPHTRTRCR